MGFNFDSSEYHDLAVNAAFIIAMILSNILMMRFYVLSMHENGAGKATVYNFVVNYFASIFFGAIFFNEVITVRLCAGVSLILAGTTLISQCSTQEKPKQ